MVSKAIIASAMSAIAAADGSVDFKEFELDSPV
jgi:hypothetical protein